MLRNEIQKIKWGLNGCKMGYLDSCCCHLLLHQNLVSKNVIQGGGVESGEWRVESGEWRVESGEWRVESGEWRVESGEWSGEWRVESGEQRAE
jgi:hypothetical protein